MSDHEGMGHRRRHNADEYDVHSKRWRRLMCWTKRAGATDRVKRLTRRRERAKAKDALRHTEVER